MDKLRRVLPAGSRDRAMIEADLLALDEQIHVWLAAPPGERPMAALAQAIEAARTAIVSVGSGPGEQ